MTSSTTIPSQAEKTTANLEPERQVEALSAQLDKLKAQLQQAQKLASLGTSAAMIAHEYNNIFAPVISYAKYALDEEDVALMRKTLSMILKHHDAVQSMSDRILGFAHRTPQTSEQVRLREVVDDAIACLGRDLSKDNILVTIEIDDHLGVRGNHNSLQQVFFNLLLNARQAMLGQAGHMKISATPISDSRVSIHVRDNGRGIDEKDLDTIFEPFFTTRQNEARQEKRGAGLGLAICKDIIEDHSGLITVESVKDHGTTFVITLPR